MRVLVLGSGAKDHALAWWLSRSHFIEDLYVAPGNYGTEALAINLDINPEDFGQVYQACLDHHIDFVFIGTEKPLFSAMVDKLTEKGIECFGCPSKSLKLEGDRDFARAFTDRHNIPTPSHKLFSDAKTMEAFLLRHQGERLVIKSKGPAPSRMMIDTTDTQQLIAFGKELLKRGDILVEEHLRGLSLSVTALVDNKGYLLLPFSSDYSKTQHEEGIPTGGMGAICPVPISDELSQELVNRIINPTIYGMGVEKLTYHGVLTFSVILSKDGPILVDYHVRFNDPSAQAIIPLIKSDALDIMYAMEHDNLGSYQLSVSTQSTVAIVIASKGYPQAPEIGKVLDPLPAYMQLNSFKDEPQVFFGAVERHDGQPITVGGRPVTIVGKGENINMANKNAYAKINKIHFEGSWYRQDIGERFLEN